MLAWAGVAGAQDAASAASLDDPWRAQTAQPRSVAELMSSFAHHDGSAASPAASAIRWEAVDTALQTTVERTVRMPGAAFGDSLTLRSRGPLRRVDGGPLSPGPQGSAALHGEHVDLTYRRGWTETLGRTDNGLDVTLSPHIGVGMGDRGGRTEAGATLRIGPDLDKLVPEGDAAFGQRPRWYVYAAGSGTAIGYNFARTRDGDFARSGVSQDEGAFLGDASIGVALRRGAVHGSVGLVYRELETEGLRAGRGVDTDVSEGLVAFQLSIKPR